MEDPFVLILLVSMLLAAISVAVLWYWWSGGDEKDTEESAVEDSPAVQAEAPPASPSETGEPTIGDFFGRLKQSVSVLMPSQPGTPHTPSPSLYPAQEAPPASASTVTSGGAIEVMRVMRDLADGSLLVEMEGRRYNSLHHMADPQVRRRFLGNAQALAQFAGLGVEGEMPDLPEIPVDVPAPPPPVSPTPPVEESPADQPVVPAAAPPPPPPDAPPPPVMSAGRSSSETVSRPQRRGLFGLGGSKESGEVEEPKTMAEEIEELLQYRLTLNPDLAQRSIHIRPAHHGGVLIEVDGQSFDGVGEVEDETARDFIQSVIQEWEARQ
jgi:hypothetical protein